MPRRIHVLPEKLANQIAAGEVVERPASVVKELLENALDAGATRVDVTVRNGGKTEIRVADDGHGMGREDALLSVDRHATSKIRSEQDLAAIRTLGFRGEALPSIASVSRMVLETAERDGHGTRVVVTGGQMAAVEECARRTGTTVAIRSLFFNVPARAKFLRTTAAENRAIGEVITTQALATPSVAFTLDSGSRDVLTLPAAGNVAERVAALWGNDAAEELLPVAHRIGPVALTGLIQRPNAARPGGRRTYLFVNGRAFTDRYLVRAADRAYKTTIAPGNHPHLFLFLEVPDGEVDVNVHPAKAEVRFRDRIGVERLIEEGVRAALAGLESTPSIGMRGAPGPAETGGYVAPHPAFAMQTLREEPQVRFNAHLAPSSAPPGPAEDPASQMTLFVTGAPSAADGAEGGRPNRVPPEMFAGAAPVMWQIHNTYILAETRSGLVLVDQHSAHERVLYEEIVRQFDGGGAESQRLLFPITLRLSPAEYALVEQIQGVLERAGFEVEPFGGRSIIVHAVPNPHPYFDAERCLREMIGELADGSPLVDSARTQHQRIALSMACKGAIKAGQKLTQPEMTELFDRLFATELPYHDIHGRPTVIQLSLNELHRRFGRSG
ncbi:DNA mismatch repair endonuclease MutL [Longimicrobium sp.]|uniref:DNA mismatch repair endonuclease MutL n=1 Tax=Longimicrobium sp. TaxID=2029185 RepID=UPI002E36DE3D|nr:DNA mismatch repair endonuclease MutL [Longimicrobium sp.]HEX6037020.1 DNA mismatch repair endonuclease MutL [Longimicrobium sp.]